MGKEEINRGQLIADNIRKILLNIDLRLLYCKGEIDLAEADFQCQSRFDSPSAKRKAMTAKSRIEVFSIYAENLNRARNEITSGLEQVLNTYSPKQKQIWTMYFIEKATIQEISTKVNYVTRNVDKIVQQFKLDLANNYSEK